MNWDLIVGVMCLWFSLVAASLHVISSPKRRAWITIPEYVRRSFLVVAAMFAWRGANFISLSEGAPVGIGHVNPEGVMAMAALTYASTTIMVWATRARLKGRAWERIQWVVAEVFRRPDMRPVMLTEAEVVHIARGVDQPTLAPMEAPSAVQREAARHRA